MPKNMSNAPAVLPDAAKKIFVGAFNAAWDGTCKKDEACAHKIAWAAVEKSYKKNADGKWVAKSEAAETSAAPEQVIDHNSSSGPSHESFGRLSMFITKANTNENGIRRWVAKASDTLVDSWGTRMSLQLFDSFIEHLDDPIPEQFRSEAWQGGMPFLGVAHYNDLNGQGIVGPTQKIYIDRNVFKAQGIFDNPQNPTLVDAAFSAIRSDIENNTPDDERIRVSIGFLDWKHAHGNATFVRKSLADDCPVCIGGTRPDVYLDGQIIHLALTRVPVNKRTEIDAWEERSGVTTRVEDAASIVGEEEAKKLEELTNGTPEVRSEAVVTFSDATGSYAAESEAVTVKSDMMGTPEGYYGGALTITDAETWLAAQQEAQRLSDLWWVFSDVMCNILWADSEAVPDKAAAMKTAVEDFKSRIESGAAVTMSRVSTFLDKFESVLGEVHMSDTDNQAVVQPTPHPLDAYFAEFRAAYDEALKASTSRQERLQTLQPAMNKLGQAVVRSVTDVTPTTVEDITSVVSKLLDEKLAALLPAKPTTEEVKVEQSKATPRQVTVERAGVTPVAQPKRGARISDIIAATVYQPGVPR